MKRSIKILVKKLEQDKQGNLKGGFSAIKGGFKTFQASSVQSTNTSCTNTTACAFTTNVNPCVNTGTCG